jgi:hypothetical protein
MVAGVLLSALAVFLLTRSSGEPGGRGGIVTGARVTELAALLSAVPGTGAGPVAPDTRGGCACSTCRLDRMMGKLRRAGLAERLGLRRDGFAVRPCESGGPPRSIPVDAWGHPFAWFPASEYEGPGSVARIRMGDGRLVSARPRRDPRTGRFRNPDTFQLFSAGPDGEFGTDDDIGNW